MTRRPPPGPAQGPTAPAAGGAVLREVTLAEQPRSLRRPGAARARHAAPAATEAPTAPVPQAPAQEPARTREAELRAAYEEGVRAARHQGESQQQQAEQRAAEAGFARGLEEGRAQGSAEGRSAAQRTVDQEARAGREEVVRRLQLLDRVLAGAQQAFMARLEAAEDEMVALCHSAVAKLVGEQLVTRAGVEAAVRRAVHEATGRAGAGSGGPLLSIHLHPVDRALLEGDAQLVEWIDRHRAGSAESVALVADERLEAGGCVVRTTEGTLDARLETQLRALTRALQSAHGVATGEAAVEVAPPAAARPVIAGPAAAAPPPEPLPRPVPFDTEDFFR
ncbi:MAG: FliH/SctL family protein [Anaeromyxobacter sp.]